MSQASAPSYPVQVALNLCPEGSLSPDASGVETEALEAGHVFDAQGERLLKVPGDISLPALSYEERIRMSGSHPTL